MNIHQKEVENRVDDLFIQFANGSENRTYISNQYFRYPYHICRAQYLDQCPSGMASVYIQSTAGGIFSNDRLKSRFHALPDSAAHVTSQASTIVHRMDRGEADLSVVIRAESGSFLEYLPDPIILFPKARLTSRVFIELDPQATVLMADSFLIHDPNERGDVFSEFRNEIEVKGLDGKLLCRDRNILTGSMYTSETLGVMGSNRVHGTFFLLSQDLPIESICTEFREESKNQLETYTGISVLPNNCGIWVRAVSADPVSLRATLQNLWRVARKLIVGAFPNDRKK
ncbi:uncharacterized protein METZ01_LOCUS118364 [marine metagenome]|uniref:Urease accessory protein UreD n=1 Tax=marine metagenome TaxID=408172 RepID=A0A381XLN9_9ZZZZ